MAEIQAFAIVEDRPVALSFPVIVVYRGRTYRLDETSRNGLVLTLAGPHAKDFVDKMKS
jgi:hypothetical protein